MESRLRKHFVCPRNVGARGFGPGLSVAWAMRRQVPGCFSETWPLWSTSHDGKAQAPDATADSARGICVGIKQSHLPRARTASQPHRCQGMHVVPYSACLGSLQPGTELCDQTALSTKLTNNRGEELKLCRKIGLKLRAERKPTKVARICCCYKLFGACLLLNCHSQLSCKKLHPCRKEIE